MLKKAFSLMEILIALALVGVLVAVLSPNLSKVMPEKKKALFIKAYTRTELAVSNMINHSEMYVDEYDPESGTYTAFGLSNTNEPGGMLNATSEAYKGDTKFGQYFARELGGEFADGVVKTNDGINYEIKFESAGTDVNKTVATITVSILDKNELVNIGVIEVENDGDVKCSDNNCRNYMSDRFNLQQDRSSK